MFGNHIGEVNTFYLFFGRKSLDAFLLHFGCFQSCHCSIVIFWWGKILKSSLVMQKQAVHVFKVVVKKTMQYLINDQCCF